MLRDLTVQNYRCFEDFNIDGLEQVNLFVGNNNSGKTSFLEAIYLLVAPDKEEALLETIENRTDYFLNNNNFFYSIKHLFYNHEVYKNNNIEINSNSTVDKKIIISISESLYLNKSFGVSIPYLDCAEYRYMILQGIGKNQRISNRSSYVNLENKEYIKIQPNSNKEKYAQIEKNINNSVFVSINKTFYEKIAFIWDTIVLTSKENKIIEALKIIDVDIERISFSSSNNANLIRIKVKNKKNPIPLSSMGEGVYRILIIAMSLVTAEDGVLLVDEIETGLHYEAQTDMWRLILETAKELNVQVFATTHSWDCIAAYQEALSQVEDSSIGKLFRLDSKYGKLRAVEYDAEDLEIATREGIEVR